MGDVRITTGTRSATAASAWARWPLADEEPDSWPARSCTTPSRILPLAMAEFAPDGAWEEGPGYWNYATVYNVVFLAGLQTALGTDFGLSDIEGFSAGGPVPDLL